MPPPLPPPAEASVGMSAAAPMAATVARAKIVLRIMGLSCFLLDVFSHPACQSGERSVGFNGARIKNARQILGAREGPRISLRDVPSERAVASRCRLACAAGLPLHHERRRRGLPRYRTLAISRRDPLPAFSS